MLHVSQGAKDAIGLQNNANILVSSRPELGQMNRRPFAAIRMMIQRQHTNLRVILMVVAKLVGVRTRKIGRVQSVLTETIPLLARFIMISVLNAVTNVINLIAKG